MDNTEKPQIMTKEHLEYLDALRESGQINMIGARPYLMQKYPSLTPEQARIILLHWIKTSS